MKTAFPNAVAVYDLAAGEQRHIEALVSRLAGEFASAESPEFVRNARRLSFAELPVGLLGFLSEFYYAESSSAVAIRGYDLDDAKLGLTPRDWNRQSEPRSTLEEELFFMLVGAAVGDVFGWSTLQNGHFVHNVVPVSGQEHEQSGHGSLARLAWHTEDGFHPYRCDYLGLMGLRNHDRISTTFASVDLVDIPAAQKEILFAPRFVLRPDNEHLNQQLRAKYESGVNPSVVAAVWQDPPPAAVLFGDPRKPYLRIDPIFMSAKDGDREAEFALQLVVDLLEGALQELLIGPGEICLIDNYKSIHGRGPFKPRYDGTDRWLKKMLLTRDLRKSRALRLEPSVSVLMPTLATSYPENSPIQPNTVVDSMRDKTQVSNLA